MAREEENVIRMSCQVSDYIRGFLRDCGHPMKSLSR